MSLQNFYLLSNCALGDSKLLGSLPEVQEPARNRKRAQSIQGR